MDTKILTKHGLLGAGVGLLLPFTLKTISNIVNWTGLVQLNLQAVANQVAAEEAAKAVPLTITTTGLTTAVNTGLGKFIGDYAGKILTVSPIPITGIEWLWTALGGALFFIVGTLAAEQLGLLKGSKVRQVTTIGVLAGFITGAILSWSLAIPPLGAFLTSIITWTILSWLIVKADEELKLNLI